MKHNESGTNGRIGRKTLAVLAVLAITATVAAAAAFTPLATLDDDSELGGATTTKNVTVTGTGSDAVLEHSDGSNTGTYESQNVTVEHPEDRETVRVTTEDLSGGNVTLEVLRFNSTSSAWEATASKTADSNITHSLDITGNDTVKYRLKASFEAAATGNITQWAIGGSDTNAVTYTVADDDETAFNDATLADGAAVKTGTDSVGETARVRFDSANYSTYTGDSFVVSTDSDREVAGVELSNVSTDVEIAAEYQNSDGDWIQAANATVSAAGTHALDIDEHDNESKWRVVVQNSPGGHAALTRAGLGTSSSDLLGGGGGDSGGGLLDWWDNLDGGDKSIVAVVVLALGLIAYDRKYKD